MLIGDHPVAVENERLGGPVDTEIDTDAPVLVKATGDVGIAELV